MAEDKFVVALMRRQLTDDGRELCTTEYFEIGPFYDPFNYQRLGGTQTVEDMSDAFVFKNQAAAEVVAALYCGRVEKV